MALAGGGGDGGAYICTDASCQTGVTALASPTKVTVKAPAPTLRDDSHLDTGNDWTVSADQARNMILQARIAQCNGDRRCVETVYNEARDPFWGGFQDGFGVGLLGGLLAGGCIVLTAGACTPIVVGIAAYTTLETAKNIYQVHGVDVGDQHFGGDVPWTQYEKGNLFGSITGGLVGGGATGLLKPSVGTILEGHATAARAQFEPSMFTEKQALAIENNLRLEPMFRGERIDNLFRGLVKNDPRLTGKVQLTPRGQFGPDVLPVRGWGWWDVTTRTAWPAHTWLYEPLFGPATGPLLYTP